MERSKRPERSRGGVSSTLPTLASFVERGPDVEGALVRERAGELFSREFMHSIVGPVQRSFRDRLLTIEILLLAVVDFVVHRVPAFLQVVDRLGSGLVDEVQAVEVTAKALYKRLRVVPHTVFLELLRQTTRSLAAGQTHVRGWVRELAPFATGIYALDDTTLDALARRTKALQRHAKGAMETLAGRLGCALDLVTGKFAEVLYDPDSKANEKTHARPLIERLGAGALYVFDLGYFAYPFFDYLSEHFCYFVTRLRKRVSYDVVAVLAEGRYYRDRLVWLGKYRADRTAHPVRLVELLIGGTWYRYLTNVWDPRLMGAAQIWALYGQRWTIEMSFAAVKRSLGLAYLRLTHINGVLIQIWATLAVYQILQDLRLEIAAQTGWQEDDVSWEMLMRRIGWYAERPSLGPTLRGWLVTQAHRLNLRKRGVRARRLTQLPAEVLAACQPPPPLPPLPDPLEREARQGDKGRRCRRRRARSIMAGLS